MVKLKYGKEYVDLAIPEKNLLGIVEPNELPRVEDETVEIIRALENPINSKRLSEITHPGSKTIIIASDITRPSPSSKLIPPLLDELHKGGVSNDDITVVFALGIHRSHTEEEQRMLVGDEIYDAVRCIDHDPSNCIQVGATKTGKPVEVFKPVAEADIVVCTGNIEFHYFAGYSGGAKAVMPGVSTREAILSNHMMMTLPEASAGRLDSPVRQEMDEAGEILGIDFILNVVLNSKKEIVHAVAGHPIDAYKAGTPWVDKMYKVPVKAADIVITCAGGAPKDINLYQAQKALENAKYAVKDGGSIILVAECCEGFGEDMFERWIEDASTSTELIKRIESNFELGGHKAAAIALVMQKADVYLISAMPEEHAKKAFFIPRKSVQDALDDAMNKHGDDATVLVMPYGGSTLPVVE